MAKQALPHNKTAKYCKPAKRPNFNPCAPSYARILVIFIPHCSF
ncbi:MAG: hypothetical protein ACJAXQ_001489 [Parvibaculaceae bacterium]|jgi:hypothetical protein